MKPPPSPFKKKIYPILQGELAAFEQRTKEPMFANTLPMAETAITALVTTCRAKCEEKEDWHHQKEIDLSDGLRWVRQQAEIIVKKKY